MTDHFRSVAPTWADLYARDGTFRTYRFLARRRSVLALLAQAGGTCLDLGCGTGEFIPDLLDRGYEVNAVDTAEEMIAAVKERVRAESWQGRVHASVGDAARLDYPDSHFDAVISVGLLEYVPDVHAVLSEIQRVLKPGGSAVMSVPNLASPFKVFETAVSLAKRSARRTLALLTSQQPPEFFRHYHFLPWRFDAQLERAGLQKEDYAFCTFGLSDATRMAPRYLELSRRMERFARTPLGLLATNYIVKVHKT